MNYAEKVKLLTFLNEPLWGSGGMSAWMCNYRAWAWGMTGVVQRRLQESELRKSITVIEDIRPLSQLIRELPVGTKYLPGIGYEEYFKSKEEGAVGSFAIQAGSRRQDLRLGEITPEACRRVIDKLVDDLLIWEIKTVNILKEAAGTDHITMYIRQPFECHDDPSFIKSKNAGVFGWEEIALVVSPEEEPRWT